MKNKRYEYIVLTATSFLVGVVLFGILSITLTLSNIPAWGIQNPILSFVFATLCGGYLFFGFLSGVLFTVKWLSNKTLKIKILLTIFFCVPIWLAMAGMFYSIPYGIYNFIQYWKIRE